MWTMEELMELKTPFLTMQDITKKDWEHLDQELVVKYNPELSHILFPDRIKMD